MTEVVYYVLSSTAIRERFITACKLMEKAFKQDSSCHVLTENEEHSKQLDDLLWSFRQGSFIPHQIQRNALLPEVSQILISTKLAFLPKGAILLNLSRDFTEDFMQFPRVIEILENDPDVKQAGRERYRKYQQLGASLVTHNL